MMLVVVCNSTLVRNGATYKPGAVLDVPVDVFEKLKALKVVRRYSAPATCAEAPVEEAPVEEVPVEEVPVEEAPVEEVPVEEAPVEEVPAPKVSNPFANAKKGKNRNKRK